MKRRDSETDFALKQAYILAGLRILNNYTPEYIDFFKPYDYYTLTEDVTDRLNEFMRQAVEDNKHLSNLSVWEKLCPFYNMVKAGGKYDLKSKPEWQQSMYIYDGEIVDQDVLGNINYGYLGESLFYGKTAFIIEINSNLILSLGAGFAQLLAGTSDLSFIVSLLDDPKDQLSIFYGINKYHEDFDTASE